MDIETLCPLCSRLDEDANHMFFKCKFTRSVWREVFLEDQRCLLMISCFGGRGVLTDLAMGGGHTAEGGNPSMGALDYQERYQCWRCSSHHLYCGKLVHSPLS